MNEQNREENVLTDVEALEEELRVIEDRLEDDICISISGVISKYKELKLMNVTERLGELYSLTVAYNLLILCASYDAAIKNIYMYHLLEKLSSAPIGGTQRHIEEIYKTKIFTKRFTNLKQQVIKENLKIKAPDDPAVQVAIQKINSLIDTRNSIAHEINHDNKGHNDLKEALEAVLTYLKWFDLEIKQELER